MTGSQHLGHGDTAAHCSAYDGGDSFLCEGVRFLADGVEQDERLFYVSGRSLDQMRAEVAALSVPGDLEAAGTLMLLSYADVADLDTFVVPEQQVAYFAAATAQAVADGHRGLRVLAELTALAAEPAPRARLLQYEHLADGYMARHPMSALCLLDRSAVSDDVLAEAMAVHPQTDGDDGLSSFRLLPDEEGLRITGVVDAWDADRLDHLLRTIAPRDSVVRLNVAELTCIGARGLRKLASHQRDLDSHGGRLELVDPRPILQRTCGALGLDLRERS